MSVPFTCDRCDQFGGEVGMGDEIPELCQDCRRREERLAKGGHGLTGKERAAVAEFLGFEVGDDGAFPVEGRMNSMVWGPEDEGGFKDFDALTKVNAFTPEAV